MAIDVRTLLLLLLIATVMMAVTLSVGAGARGRGLGRWNVGLGLLSIGWALLFLRGQAPDLLTKPLANALFQMCLLLQIDAIQEFRGRRPSRWRVPVGGLATFLVLLALMHDYILMTLATNLAFVVLLAAIAVLAARVEPAGGRARWMLAAMNALASVALAIRFAGIALAPERYPGILAPGLPQTVAFVALFGAIIGSTFAFLLMHRDRAEAEIRRLAMVDGLTGLLNRRALMEQAERELARARRAGVPFTLLIMDLDHFKRVNDEHGHQAGDRVLADFARRLEACLRTEDLRGRYGGEEFCAILPGATPERAMEIGERIRAAVLDPALGGLAKPVTMSIGIATCPAGDPSLTLDHAIARADVALYDAKRLGRNRIAQVPCQPAPPALSLAA